LARALRLSKCSLTSASIEQQAELNKTKNDCNAAKNNDHAEEESEERRTELAEQRGKEAP
jgi:hypothetical protein